MAYSCNPYGESLLQLQANTADRRAGGLRSAEAELRRLDRRRDHVRAAAAST